MFIDLSVFILWVGKLLWEMSSSNFFHPNSHILAALSKIQVWQRGLSLLQSHKENM